MSRNPSATRRGVALIVRFVRMHPAPFVASLVGGVMWAAMIVALSETLRWVTDEAVAPAFRGESGVSATSAGLWLLAAGVLRGFAVVVRRWFGSVTEARMQASLRRDAARRLVNMSPEATRAFSTGELMSRTDVDVTAATNLLMPLPFSLGVVALILFALVSLLLADVAFAMVAVVMFPLLSALSRVYTARTEGPAAIAQQRVGRVSAVAHESFDGVEVVKTLGLEASEGRRFADAAGRLRDARLDVVRVSARFQPLFDTIPQVGMVALLLVGAWRIGSGAVSEGELVQAVALFGFLAFPMRIVGFLFESLPRAVVAVDRVDELIALPTIGPQTAATMEGTRASAVLPADVPLGLSVEGLGFAYRTLGDDSPAGQGVDADSAAVVDVTFDVAPGEAVALVGPTGSGKSTVIRLLIGLEQPDEGDVFVVDDDSRRVNVRDVLPSELRRAVATVFQESFLFADSVERNVGLGESDEIDTALEVADASGFVGELPDGVRTVVGERGVTLSGGQRQRVALARALARRPRVLLLDDATSAVDPVVERRILDRLRATEATMLIVAHRLSTIATCDRVVHLDGGRVVGIGTHDELVRSSAAYASLVSAYETDQPAEAAAALVEESA